MAPKSSFAFGCSDCCNALDSVTVNFDAMSENELIAEFMGGWNSNDTRHLGMNVPWGGDPHWEDDWYDYKDMKYQSSWDWLMPVVEKIESIVAEPSASLMVGWDHWKDQFNGEITTDINVAYSIVVEFIKWYNTNKL